MSSPDLPWCSLSITAPSLPSKGSNIVMSVLCFSLACLGTCVSWSSTSFIFVSDFLCSTLRMWDLSKLLGQASITDTKPQSCTVQMWCGIYWGKAYTQRSGGAHAVSWTQFRQHGQSIYIIRALWPKFEQAEPGVSQQGENVAKALQERARKVPYLTLYFYRLA